MIDQSEEFEEIEIFIAQHRCFVDWSTSVFHKLIKLLEEVVPLFRIKFFLRLGAAFPFKCKMVRFPFY